ncbi:glycosyltransferase family 2 protein (plasmid) [Salipiger sp. H15]|uniref:Glycosyltransferase family 2 protein n=1 Tax=Alloyangia sp. H15 TaxID=3029062 RepID=A0AAU8AQE6_9RHOB
MTFETSPLVNFRTPTYRRGPALERCLLSMIGQTHENWVADVYDDDPAGSAEAVVEAIGDPRIHYHHNQPQLFGSRNIDQCFSRRNPRDADFFAVVEDDNWIFPGFAQRGIELARAHGVEIVFTDQVVEDDSGTEAATLTDRQVLKRRYKEGVFSAQDLHIALMVWHGLSNGGIFWSRNISSDLEIKHPCNSTIQEYLRALCIQEPVYVSTEAQGVWANYGARTLRNLGDTASELKRELHLKKAIRTIRRAVWANAPASAQALLMSDEKYRFDRHAKLENLFRSHLGTAYLGEAPLSKSLGTFGRSLMVLAFGRTEPAVGAMLREKGFFDGEPPRGSRHRTQH